MALTAGILSDGSAYTICSAEHGSLLSGMVPMYLLMSAFHSPPWLKLISSRSAAEAAYGKNGTVR